MSKYILMVNLPDDGKCDGCRQYHYRRQGGIGLLFHDIGSCGESLFPEIVNKNRPDDCPLIPVDRVMKRITTTVEPNGYFNDAAHRALDEAISILCDELGLEE